MERDFSTNELLALLDWYREVGVTHAVDEATTDWLHRGSKAPGSDFSYPDREAVNELEQQSAVRQNHVPNEPQPRETPTPPDVPRSPPSTPVARQSSPPPVARVFPTATPDAAAFDARVFAAKANSLVDLRLALEAFNGCALKATAKKLCFYRGADQARLMVIGEAPGRDEDLEGRPFIGPAGQLLDKMLAAIGQSDSDTHITNIVYWRPPGNRTPTPQEGQLCRPFLERQIEFVKPDVLLLLGGASAKHMLETPEGIMKLRGSWHTIDVAGRRLKTMASLHPAYLLRTPTAKRQAWADLLAVKFALLTNTSG